MLEAAARTVSDALGQGQHTEGRVARAIEQQTARLPSDVFLWAAFASIGGSLLLHMAGKKDDGIFVGHWAPTFLLLGLYNKIVKVAGSDRSESSLATGF